MGNIINGITIIFCAIIISLTGIAWRCRYKSYKYKKSVGSVTAMAPTAIITMGILGTFAGILVGLWQFDTTDINNSIPFLLEGLKMAFATSVAGMICSLFLKWRFGEYENNEIAEGQINVNDPVLLLKQISEGVSNTSNALMSIEEKMVKFFQSDEEYSLVSQLKILRIDINDLKREVIKSLHEFGEKVAELGTKAIIEALRDVIEDFNAHLNDLVGAEFKQLKEAMIKLVEWQENYRIQVDEMQERLSNYLIKLEKTTELLNEISLSLEKSEKLIANTNDHLDSIDGSLSAITLSTDDMEKHAQRLNDQNAQLKEFIIVIERIGKEAADYLPSIAKHVDIATRELVYASEQAKENLKNAGEILSKNVLEIMEKQNKHIKDIQTSTDEVTKEIQEHINAILKDSLESLGGQLAVLTEKFVDDYGPLADKLRNVVHIAEGIGDIDNV